jgi:hypothetical protein
LLRWGELGHDAEGDGEGAGVCLNLTSDALDASEAWP